MTAPLQAPPQQRRRRTTGLRQILAGLCLGSVTIRGDAAAATPLRAAAAASAGGASAAAGSLPVYRTAAFIPHYNGGQNKGFWGEVRRGRQHPQEQQQQQQRQGQGRADRATVETISSSSSYSSFPSFSFFSFRSSLFGGVTPLASTRRRSSEEEEEDVDIESRSRKEAVRVTSSEQLQYLLSPEGGLRLRDLDVRGDSTATLLSSSSPSFSPLPHPVAVAIHGRIASKSQPGARADGMKIGLSLEGGGMRGCVGAGMLAAINHLGLRDAFDVVYGSSAGSLMGAFFLSGQTPLEGPGIYYDILSQAGKDFIDQRQIMRSIGLGALDFRRETYGAMLKRQPGKPVLNLDFLLQTVIERLMPLDWNTFWARNQLIPLKVVASALLSKQSVPLSSADGNFQTLQELAQCMRASMLLPGIAGPLVRIGEDRTGSSLERTFWPEPVRRGGQRDLTKGSEPLCDAMLFEPIPYRSALKENCTHVLVLRTRPDGVSVTGKMGLVEKLMYRRFFSRKNDLPGVAEWMVNQQHKRIYAEDVLRLNQEARVPSSTGPSPLMTIALREDMPEIHRLEMRRPVLLEGVRNGFAVAYDMLVQDAGMRGKGAEVARQVFLVAEGTDGGGGEASRGE